MSDDQNKLTDETPEGTAEQDEGCCPSCGAAHVPVAPEARAWMQAIELISLFSKMLNVEFSSGEYHRVSGLPSMVSFPPYHGSEQHDFLIINWGPEGVRVFVDPDGLAEEDEIEDEGEPGPVAELVERIIGVCVRRDISVLHADGLYESRRHPWDDSSEIEHSEEAVATKH